MTAGDNRRPRHPPLQPASGSWTGPAAPAVSVVPTPTAGQREARGDDDPDAGTISNCPRGSRSAPWATSSTGIIDDESHDHVGFEEKIKLMPERRGPRRAARARSPGSSGRRGSNTRTRASRTSKIPPERKPGRDRIERLASCQWVRDRETLIIIPRHGKREKPRSARPSATPHAAGESPHDTCACRTCSRKSTAPGSTAGLGAADVFLETERKVSRMFSLEERSRAVELYLTTPMTTAQVVECLGYPTRQCLERWLVNI